MSPPSPGARERRGQGPVRQRPVQGHAPRKRFGQNFLVDPGVIAAMIALIAPGRDEPVVEIGPGLGALTDALLEVVGHLTVVEIDRDLVARLRARHPPSRLHVHEGDALQVDWSTVAQARRRLRIVGNLPYNISSPLLVGLLAARHRVLDQHFMLQREVVDRIVAGPGPRCSRLGILLQAYYRCERMLDVPPEAFDPPPKVRSAVVRMQVRDAPLAPDADALAALLAVAFAHRRKMIRSTVLPWLSARGIAVEGIDGSLRVEQVGAAFWYDTAARLHAGHLAGDIRFESGGHP